MRKTARLLAAILSLFLSVTLFAQNSANVTGTLLDGNSGEPVGFATVSLTPKGSTKVSKYVLSTSAGKVTIEGVRHGTYTLKAEMMGYKTYTQEITIRDRNLALGDLKMEVDQEVLDAASVSAMGNAVVVKKDTVEYNASSFATTDNDMLINLLKKLPGIEVADDGTITSNGERVTKIYIDGKTFFMDDPQLASQNIPAKMIEKLKVIKKKSEQAEFSGVDDGQEETVIDLSVQQSMMNGMFANVMLGAGHDLKGEDASGDDVPDWMTEHNDAFRFQSNAFIGNFRKNSQVSLILNANNANTRGFGDIAGGNMRAMMGGGGGGFGGGGGGGGITTSWMGGLNGSVDLFDNDMQLAGNYVYNGSNTYSGSLTSRTTHMRGSEDIVSDTESHGVSNSGGHRFGIRLEHKFSENTSILFEPQVNFGGGNFNNSSLFNTVSVSGVPSNDGWSSSNGLNNNWATSGRFLLRQRLGMPGRTLTANVNWNYSENKMESYNQSLTNTYRGGTKADVPTLVNQRSEQNTNNVSASGRVEYTEPMGGNFYLSANYAYNWSESHTNKDTYNSGVYDWHTYGLDNLIYVRDGETYDDVYSNSIYNRNITQNIGFNAMYQSSKLHAQVGAALMPRNIYNMTNGRDYEDKSLNWAPNASVFANFNDFSNMRFFYNGRSSQPSTTQLMPVMDNSNPLSMTLGNPYLVSYFNHSVRLEYGYTNRQTFFSLRTNLNGSMTTDPIVNAVWYDPAMVQYRFPVNGKASKNASFMFMVNTPIGKSNFRVSTNTNVNVSQSHSYIGAAKMDMSDYFNENKEFDYVKFHDAYWGKSATKKFESDFLDNRTTNLNVSENLSLTYRLDNLELTAGARTRMSKPWYTVVTDETNQKMNWTNTVSGSANWTVGQTGLNFNLNGNYTWYEGFTTNPGSSFIINTEFSKTIFRGAGTFALRAYDLLNQTKTFSVSDSENYHTESRSIALGRYVIASLTFRLGTFGGRRGGMGGPRGGDRGPGGPGGFGGGRGFGGPPMR